VSRDAIRTFLIGQFTSWLAVGRSATKTERATARAAADAALAILMPEPEIEEIPGQLVIE
jgi:hypothetical protein